MANSIPVSVLAVWAFVPFALFGAACVAGSTSSPPEADAPVGMTFAECQASGEYPGGRYAVSFDNGVCTVQKPATTTTTTVQQAATTTTTSAVAYANCTEVRAAGKAPLSAGEPGYSSKLDRDGDGTACDS